MTRSRFAKQRAVALLASGGLVATAGLAGLGPTTATASSHREAPMIAGLPQYDNTDVYAFRSPDRQDTVTLVANWLPFQEPAGGPNFYPFANDAHHDIHIDNDADAKPDITFRWTFKDHYRNKNTFLYNTGPVTSLNDKDLNFYQTYRLVRIAGGKTKVLVKNARVAPSNVGEASMPDYAKLRNEATKTFGKIRSFTGQAEDPFFLDLRVFDLLYGGDLSEVGDDTLQGFNVNSVALQVPRKMLTRQVAAPSRLPDTGVRKATPDPVVGIWSTTSQKSIGGKHVQVSRLGNPLVNEVVIPLKLKDAFNASKPTQDVAALKYVTNPELPRLIEAVYDIPAPKTPRKDLVSVFLTGVKGLNMPKGKITPSEQLRLNTSTPVTANPDRLGVIGGDVQGFPNGRRLGDDVVDIALQVVEGELVGSPNDLGDGVDNNDTAFGNNFPYLALPVSGSEDDPHPTDSNGSANPAGFMQSVLPGRTASAGLVGIGALAMLLGAAGIGRRRKA